MTTPTHIPNPYDLLAGEGPVVQISNRWFITMHKAGFNLPENNGRGWATREAAMEAHLALVREGHPQRGSVTVWAHRDGLVQMELSR